jgi:hypothetical protein
MASLHPRVEFPGLRSGSILWRIGSLKNEARPVNPKRRACCELSFSVKFYKDMRAMVPVERNPLPAKDWMSKL